jgi:hypothetical protein
MRATKRHVLSILLRHNLELSELSLFLPGYVFQPTWPSTRRPLKEASEMRRTAKIFTEAAAVAGSLLASTATMHAQETRKPNILFIMGDDSMSQGPQTAQR